MKGSKLIATVSVLLIALGCLLFTPITWAEGPFDVDQSTNDDGRNNSIGDGQGGTGDGDGMLAVGDTPSDWWYFSLALQVSIDYLFENLHKADAATRQMHRTGQQESGPRHAVGHK